MSFLTAISSNINQIRQDIENTQGIPGLLSRSAITTLNNQFVNKFLNIEADPAPSKQPNPGVKITLNPDTTNYIPVIYGQAYTGGMITDAIMSADNLTMWYCLTISEKTGNKIDGTPSVFSFKEVYFEGLRLDFKSDGYTVDRVYDEEGNSSDKYSGLMQIFPFNGNSNSPTNFTTESSGNSSLAYNLFPSWDGNKMMSNLNFVLVKVKYDAEAEIKDLKNLTFRVENSMKDIGDVLYDYAINGFYGVAIPESDLEIT